MRPDWTIWIFDDDGTIEEGLECLADIKSLSLPADQHRYRLEFARGLARRLGCRGPRSLRGSGGFTRSRGGIELRLQIRLDDVPLHLRFRHLGERLRLVTLSLLLCLGRDGSAKCSLGVCKLRLGSE